MSITRTSSANDVQFLKAVKDLSDALHCNLDQETLNVLVELCDLGIAPDALARSVLELREAKVKLEASDKRKERIRG